MRALALVVAALLPASAGAAALDEASLNALFDGSAVRALPHAAPAARAASPASPAPLSKEDREEIAAVLEGARRAAAAWPGYDLLAEPLLIVRPGGRSFLIGHPNPPADFAPQAVAGRVVYVSDAPRDPGFSYRFDYPVGGATATALRVGEDGSAEDAAMIVHEGFHRYQGKRWSDRPWGEYRVEDADDIAAAELEQRALSRALEAGAGWRAPAEEFVALRRLRRLKHPEIAVDEDWQEQQEGTARFVEIAAVPAADSAGPLPEQLRRPLSLEDMPKSRYYLTGDAMGRLLDRAGIAWRARVEKGASLYELLAQALAMPGAEADRLAAAAIAAPEYAALRAAASGGIAAFQAERAAALARFDAQPGLRLSVAATGYFGAKRWYRLPRGGDLLDPASPYVIDKDGWLLRVEDRAVLMTDGASVAVVDPALLFVDGARWVSVVGSRRFTAMTLSMPGVELHLQGGSLSFDGKTLTVRR